MKSRYVKLPPELVDGQSWTVSDNPLDIGDAIMRWLYSDGLVGDRVTLQIVEMTREEVEALPII